MGNIVVGDMIKSGLTSKIAELFPNITVYKEAAAIPRYPHFFVQQLTMSSERELNGRYMLNYLVTVRYRAVEDPTTLDSLQSTLDDVALKLLEIDYINLWSEKQQTNELTLIKNQRYEKIEGVLHYFCNVTIRVQKEVAEVEKQRELDLTHYIKGV